LASDGFVVQNSYKGTHVVKLHSKEVNEILTVRIALEAEAVRLAKPNITDEIKTELRGMIEKLEATNDPHAHVEQDFMFHQRLWELSGNETLKRTLIHVTAPLFAMSTIIRDSKRFNKESSEAQFGEHEKLLEAILEGETEEAVEAMRTHIERNRKVVGENFDKFLEAISNS
jgi:DNA-binding GntR family transcriptional regulator